MIDAYGNTWTDISTPTDKDWPNSKYIKTRRSMIALTFIRKHTDPKYRKKLIDALESYLRRQKDINFHEYSVQDMISEMHILRQQRGVGKVSIDHLQQKLTEAGYG